jgi:hypothetical protein
VTPSPRIALDSGPQDTPGGRPQPIADHRIGRHHLAVDIEQDGVALPVVLDEVAAADRDLGVAQ